MLLVDDNHLNLWTVDVATARRRSSTTTRTTRRAATSTPSGRPTHVVAYTKSLDSHMRAIFVRSLADAQSRQAHRRARRRHVAGFDANGKYLYFLASTDYGPRTGWVEMSAVDRPSRRSVYLAVLNASDPSPPPAGDG